MRNMRYRIGGGLLWGLCACASPDLVPQVPSQGGVAVVEESGYS